MIDVTVNTITTSYFVQLQAFVHDDAHRQYSLIIITLVFIMNFNY
jgi:hypothetical protein